MKKTFEFTLLEFIILILSTIVAAILIIYGFHFTINLLSNSESKVVAFTGAIGNFSGGLIGGIVAYLVAAYQINKTKQYEIEKKDELKNSILLLIKSELNYNLTLIKKYKTDFSEEEIEVVKYINFESWEKNSNNLVGKISIGSLESLIKLNAIIKSYKSTSPSIPIDSSDKLIECIENNIREIDSEITPHTTK